MIVDGEKVISRYLRGRLEADEDAGIAATRVVGKTPSDLAAAWVRITELDAPQDPSSQFDHLVAFYLQLDCYASATGGQPQAKLLARTVRAALLDAPAASHTDCVVTSARVNGFSRVPDTGIEPARERVIITATIHAHPA